MKSKRIYHNAMLAAIIDLCTKDSNQNTFEDEFLKELSNVVDKHFKNNAPKFAELISALETVEVLLDKDMSAKVLCDAMGVFDEAEENVSIDLLGMIKQMRE